MNLAIQEAFVPSEEMAPTEELLKIFNCGMPYFSQTGEPLRPDHLRVASQILLKKRGVSLEDFIALAYKYPRVAPPKWVYYHLTAMVKSSAVTAETLFQLMKMTPDATEFQLVLQWAKDEKRLLKEVAPLLFDVILENHVVNDQLIRTLEISGWDNENNLKAYRDHWKETGQILKPEEESSPKAHSH